MSVDGFISDLDGGFVLLQKARELSCMGISGSQRIFLPVWDMFFVFQRE